MQLILLLLLAFTTLFYTKEIIKEVIIDQSSFTTSKELVTLKNTEFLEFSIETHHQNLKCLNANLFNHFLQSLIPQKIQCRLTANKYNCVLESNIFNIVTYNIYCQEII